MRLNLFTANTTSAAINSAIDALGKNNTAASRHTVIVPDRFTLSVERDIYRRLGLDGSFNIDVASFSRLAAKIAPKGKPFLSKEGTVMLMKRVIDDNAAELLYFRNRVSIGFAREIFAVTASLRSSGISSAALKEAAASFDAPARQKYLDLALLYEAYEATLAAGFADTVSRLKELIEAINTDNTVSQSHVYVLGFNIFSELQLQLIKRLCVCAESVSVAFAAERSDIFLNEQIDVLKSFAGENGIAVVERSAYRRLRPPFDTIHKELFSLSAAPTARVTDGVKLLIQRNPYEEVKAVAREIIRRVKSGFRFKDIAVVCCQDNYGVCIKEIFARFKIPFFLDEKYNAAHSRTAKYLSRLIEAVIYGFRRDKVLNFIKHPDFCADDARREQFENYCLEFNVNYARFLSPFAADGEAHEPLRARFAEVVSRLPQTASAAEFAAVLTELLPEESGGEDLFSRASLEAAGRIKELMAEVRTVTGESRLTLDEFYSILADGIAGLEIALVPQYLDCVFIGNTEESRFGDARCLFVIGAAEDYFPRKTGEQLIIGLSDMLSLEKKGLRIYPGPLDVNRLEQFVALDLLTKAENLYVSCSVCGLTGEPLQTGEAMKDLSYLLGIQPSPTFAPDGMTSDEELVYLLATPENALHEYIAGSVPEEYAASVGAYLEKSGVGCASAVDPPPIKNLLDYVAHKDGFGYIMSASRMESYFCCPFMHYLKYGLSLRERPSPVLTVTDAGSIIHKFLEVFFTENLERLRTLTDSRIEKESSRIIARLFAHDKLSGLREDNLAAYTMELIRGECMYAVKKLLSNVRKSSFTPTYIELSFGGGEPFPPLTLQTSVGEVALRGKIDRVDVCGGKAVIIDYKTGAASGRYQEIFFGKKIQLYVYMNIFLERGFKPAGAFYLPIKDSYRKDGESFAFIGQAERSPTTLIELDNGLAEGGRSDIFNVAIENGRITTRSKNLITAAEFANICAYVKRLIAGAADEIAGGNIDKSPLGDMCRSCAYKNHCDVSLIRPRQDVPIDVDDFMEEV